MAVINDDRGINNKTAIRLSTAYLIFLQVNENWLPINLLNYLFILYI